MIYDDKTKYSIYNVWIGIHLYNYIQEFSYIEVFMFNQCYFIVYEL